MASKKNPYLQRSLEHPALAEPEKAPKKGSKAAKVADATETNERLWAIVIASVLGVALLTYVLIRIMGWGDNIHEVSGKVTRNGQPIEMANCQIVFTIFDKGVLVPARLDAEGKYRVRTPAGYGLVEGTYTVYVSFPKDYLPPTDGAKPLPPKKLEAELSKFIPKRFRSPGSSGLVLELKEDMTFDVDMTD